MDEKFVKEEYDYAIGKINQWYLKKSKTLSIVSPPYNEEIIFRDIILKVLKNKERVLYIWNGDKSNKRLLNLLRESNFNFTQNYIVEGDCTENLVFTSSECVENITGKFDLTILDDITAFSNISKQEIVIKYIWIAHISEKVILYSVEKTINIGDNIEVTYLHKKNPFTEPRIIPTKVDLNKDVPCIVYDYLKWFMNNKESTIIIVPSEEKIDIVYDYYVRKVKVTDCKIYPVRKRDYNKSFINNELKEKDKAIIIITDSIDLSVINFKFVNIIVLFADDRKFNYKKVLYLCGKAGKTNESIPEILLVLNEETDEINLIKSIARGFNKKVWERKYSNYLK